MKAEIQKIGTDETHYYNVTIDGLFVGVFKYLSDNKEWGFTASAGSKNKHQLRAIEEALFHVDEGFPEVCGCDHLETNKPVKGY